MYLGFFTVLSEACWEDRRGEGRGTLIQGPQVRPDDQRPLYLERISLHRAVF